MKEHLKKLGKLLLTAVVWVFVLSINVGGKPVFYHANDVLVQNELVQTIDTEVSNFFYKLKSSLVTAFQKSPDKPAKEKL